MVHGDDGDVDRSNSFEFKTVSSHHSRDGLGFSRSTLRIEDYVAYTSRCES